MAALVYMVAGEASGDLHGSNLVAALKRLSPDIRLRGLGGRRMESAGCRIEFHLADHSIMGFTEVVRKLLLVRRVFKEAVESIRNSKPDVVILIDYPDFNLRFAAEAKKLGIPVVYYISPQVWAWRRGRVNRMVGLIDKMLVILPFEKEIYQQAGIPVEFVGHPLIDHLGDKLLNARLGGEFAVEDREPVFGLLPGSRKFELKRLLPEMLGAAEDLAAAYPRALFLVAASDAENHKAAEEMSAALVRRALVKVVESKTYEVIAASTLCFVASGTATLETACFLKPMLVMYKCSFISYQLAKRLVSVPYISLVNLLAGEAVVPELIQHAACAGQISACARDLLADQDKSARMVAKLKQVKELLGPPGASQRAAEHVLALLN